MEEYNYKGKARGYTAENMRGLIFVNSGVRNYHCNNMILWYVAYNKNIEKILSWDEKKTVHDK